MSTGILAEEDSSTFSPSDLATSSVDGRPLWDGWSLTTTAQTIASRSVTIPRMRKTSLHPTASASTFRGPLAAMAPTFPTAMTTPLRTAKSFFGNQTDISFISGT